MHRITIILVLLFFGFSSKVFACRCAVSNVNKAVKTADAIVVGTILNKRKFTIYDSSGTYKFSPDTTAAFQKSQVVVGTVYAYDLKVEHVYKGAIEKDTIRIYSEHFLGCGMPFQTNSKYIVYGTARGSVKADNEEFNGERLWTDFCSRTTKYSQAEVDKIKRCLR